MKNIFNVESDETKRILSLHENSTKKQYLNVLNVSESFNEYIADDKASQLRKQNNKKAFGKKGTWDNPYTDKDLQKWPVDWLVDTIDGYSNKGDLENMYRFLQAFKGKVAIVDTGAKKIKKGALSRIYDLYKSDEDVDLAYDIKQEKAWATGSKDTISRLVNFINSTRNEKVTEPIKKSTDPNQNQVGYGNKPTDSNSAVNLTDKQKQFAEKTTNLIKQIQKQLGKPETGIIDVSDIKLIVTKINGK